MAVYNGLAFGWYVARINRTTSQNEDTWMVWLSGDFAPYSVHISECEKVYNAEQLEEKEQFFLDQLVRQIIQQNNATIDRIKKSLEPHVIRRLKEYGKAKIEINITAKEDK